MRKILRNWTNIPQSRENWTKVVSGITGKLISETQENRDLSNLSVSAKIYTGIKYQQG